MTDWIEKLQGLRACEDAIEWCEAQSTPNEAWNNCSRPDWMLWCVARVSGKPGSTARRTLAGVLVEIVRPIALNGDSKLFEVLETLVRYSQGDATVEEVCIAAVAAADADYTSYASRAVIDAAKFAYADYSYYSAAAADYAGSTSFCAAHAGDDATYHGYHNYPACCAAAAAECDRQITIIRKHYPEPPQ